MGNKFVLLKRTFPTSKFDRYCDGYDYIMSRTTKEQREELGIKEEDLQKIIKKGENYMYQVGKVGKEFKTSYISIKNYEIIRKHYFGQDEDDDE